MLCCEIGENESKTMYPNQRELQENYSLEEILHAIDYNKLSELPIDRIQTLKRNVETSLSRRLENYK